MPLVLNNGIAGHTHLPRLEEKCALNDSRKSTSDVEYAGCTRLILLLLIELIACMCAYMGLTRNESVQSSVYSSSW